MSLLIKKGYLISRRDYDLFDEVLTFISYDGNRYTIFAPGVRKITSKNSRSLFYGNYLEFEFFQSRFQNKMSKLKKVVTLSSIGYELSNHPSLDLVSEIITNIVEYNHEYFEFYQKILNYVLLNIDTKIINIFIYLYFLCIFHILDFYHYKRCKHTRNPIIGFELKQKIFVCQKCLNLDTVLLDDKTVELMQTIFLNHDNIEYHFWEHDFGVIESILKKIFHQNRKIIYGK